MHNPITTDTSISSDAASDAASLQHLQSVLDTLLGPNGCSWDKEQTPESLADYLIEECHELVSAIRFGSTQDICEELGDVAFLLLFVATLQKHKNAFSLQNALDTAAAKMIRRHPHVFAETTFESREAQLKAWEDIKRAEKHDTTADNEEAKPKGIFDSLPTSLPPLIKAYRIHSKAARVDFTWQEEAEVEQQVEAEWLEWLDVAQSDNKEAQMHELGDMLFTLVELGRRKGIKASEALDYSTARFLQRFAHMETIARARGLDFAALDLDAKDLLWNEAKAAEEKN